MCFLKKQFRGRFRQKLAKFSFGTICLEMRHIVHLAPEIGEGAVS
jgi:hypothetical protein